MHIEKLQEEQKNESGYKRWITFKRVRVTTMAEGKSGVVLTHLGVLTFQSKKKRDEFMQVKLREGFFCYPYCKEWPTREFSLQWYAEIHKHYQFCGGLLIKADIEPTRCFTNTITEAEVYSMVALLLAAGVTVSFTYRNGEFKAQTFLIKDWRKLPWAKAEETVG